MTPEPAVIWEPTPKQAEFLTADEDEVLLGGAAGGGKTDCLIVDAMGLQHKAIYQPEYRALLLRRSYPELKEVLDRTKVLYPDVVPGAVFNQKDSDWRFPSGARIEFSYLDNDTDVMKYQSRQFQWLGWEELAQWGSEFPYEYMLSRLRAPVRFPIPLFVRSTCNPDGPGARWIAARFGINPDGSSSRVEMEVNGRIWRRRFIAARLEDNPHLAGTGYREKLMMLPEVTRRALLDGRWDEPPIAAAIYANEMMQMADEGRIRPLPYDPRLPVHTCWDLGWNDAMTVIMVQKPLPNVLNVINYLEDSQKTYAEYIRDLNGLGYLWGTDWLPHDGANKDPKSGMSAQQVLRMLGRRQVRLMGRSDVEAGIKQARMMFPRAYIDNTARKRLTGYLGAARLIECLRHYRRVVPKSTNEPASPLHDQFSHGSDAWRGLAQIADQIRNEGDEAPMPRVEAWSNPIEGMGLLGALAGVCLMLAHVTGVLA